MTTPAPVPPPATAADIAQAVAAALQQRPLPAAHAGWGQTPPPPPAAIGGAGLLVPLKLHLQGATIRVYLQLGPEAATPQGAEQAIAALAQAGAPLDAWQDRDSGGWGGNRAGWGNGYNRSSYGRGRW